MALTGDLLNEAGSLAYGDAGLRRLLSHHDVSCSFLNELAPKLGDHDYWSRLYSLEVTANHIQEIDEQYV